MKLLNIFFLAAISALCAVSCTQQNSDGTVQCTESPKEAITSSVVCKLGENIDYISDVFKFKVISDTTFLTLFVDQVYLYNMDGSQICKIGRKGRARGEYIYPMAADIYDGHIFISCVNSKKIIEYTLDGKFVKEYKDILCGVRDFVVGDKYIQIYGEGTLDEKLYYLHTYDKDRGEIVAKMGEYDDVDKIFKMTTFCNGFVSATDDESLMLRPSNLKLIRYTPDDEELLLDIDSPSYQVDANVDYETINQPPYKKLTDFIENNSTVIYTSLCDDDLYIVTNESFEGDTFDNTKADRNMLIVNTESGRGEYRKMAQEESSFDVYYQMYNGKLYSLAVSNGSYYIKKINL